MSEKIKTREEFFQFIRYSLGEPKVKVELSNNQIENNLFRAVNLYRKYAVNNGLHRAYIVVDLKVGQRIYKLPDNISTVVATKLGPSENTSAWTLATLSGAMASDALSLRNFDLTSYTMINMWLRMLRILTRSTWRFLFDNNTKNLTVMPTPDAESRLFLEVFSEAKVDDVLDDYFVREYTLALCMMTLGRIRSKFPIVPGFNGNIQMDGNDLIVSGEEKEKVLKDDLILSFQGSRPPLPVFHN